MAKITVRGDVDPRAIEQLTRCAEYGDAPLAAACADAHVGYSLCVGGVVGYRDYVSPSGVGYDIGCGNMAVRTNLRREDIGPTAPIMDEIVRRVDFGMGTRPGNEADHPVLEQIAKADFVPQRGLAQLARDQLGTVGSGNHYVDLFEDENRWVWIGVHFGSRGFGHKTASGFLAMAKGRDFSEKTGDGEMDAPPTLFHIKSDIGESYIAAMKLAGAYAYAGREVVVQRVLEILGAETQQTVHNHHNFAWLEDHVVDGEHAELWVVRKGATPAFPGQQGFVGATMGEPSVILQGARTTGASTIELAQQVTLQQNLMFSTVHGAGRLMSRNEAAGKWKKVWQCGDRDCKNIIPTGSSNETPAKGSCAEHPNARPQKVRMRMGGRVDWAANLNDLHAKGIELRGAAADEGPLAYKRLGDVLRHQGDTVRILHTLYPIGVAMASSDIHDLYKD